MVVTIVHRIVKNILYRADEGIVRKALLSPLWVLSLLYGAAVSLRLFLYAHGILRIRRLPVRTVCMGNITVGGTGKTPLVIAAARFLTDHGLRVGVVSRGYGRRSQGTLVVSDGSRTLLGPEEAGDEPVLLARKLPGVPIAVGEDRYAAASLLASGRSLDIVILDDGFSHLGLGRDLDVLAFKAGLGVGNGHLLPRGPLREPLRNVTRAKACVIVGENPALKDLLRRLSPGARIFKAGYRLSGLRSPKDGTIMNSSQITRAKLLAFCGIADPESFFNILEGQGLTLCGKMAYPDHYWYTEDDLARISMKKGTIGADFAVTTEKDYARASRMLHREELPLLVAECDLSVEEGLERYFLSCIGR